MPILKTGTTCIRDLLSNPYNSLDNEKLSNMQMHSFKIYFSLSEKKSQEHNAYNINYHICHDVCI